MPTSWSRWARRRRSDSVSDSREVHDHPEDHRLNDDGEWMPNAREWSALKVEFVTESEESVSEFLRRKKVQVAYYAKRASEHKWLDDRRDYYRELERDSIARLRTKIAKDRSKSALALWKATSEAGVALMNRIKRECESDIDPKPIVKGSKVYRLNPEIVVALTSMLERIGGIGEREQVGEEGPSSELANVFEIAARSTDRMLMIGNGEVIDVPTTPTNGNGNGSAHE